MDVTIRPERANDYDEILRMTYDAFLTLDYPGRRRMDEHFLILLLQDCDRTIPELRFVAEHDGKIVGHIFYARTAFRRPDGTHAETVTFGPLTVDPKFHRMGIGKALVSHTLEIAREMGFGAVIITGVPEYYPKLGFKRAREYGLAMEDGSSPDALMVYELKSGYLSGGGVFDTWPAEYDRAEQDDEGYNAFNIAYAKKHFPGEVTLRPLFEADVTLMQKWLEAPHVARWYEHPDAWGMELAERHGEFSFITHFIAEYEGIPFGFCQYYDCHLAQAYEDWDSTWRISERKGEVFSIDYLIGEPDYLRRGFGKAMVAQMMERLQAIGAEIVIVQPEKENAASIKTLVECGFEQQGSEYVLDLHRPNMNTIETERLLLRPLTLADAETAFYGWTGDTDVAEWVSWLPHHSLDETVAWLREIDWEQVSAPRDNYIWGFVLKETGELFGSGGLIWEDDWKLYQVGYNLMKKHWNHGYTTEAMKAILGFAVTDLGIRQVLGGHAKANPASGRVLEKLGFIYQKDSVQPHIDGKRFFDSKDYLLDLMESDYGNQTH